MKSIQKRIYNVLPRVTGAATSSSSSSAATSPTAASLASRERSGSFSSSNRPFHTASGSVSPLNFFDSPPPPSTRTSIPSPSRLPVEVKPAEIEGSPHTTHTQSPQSNVTHPPFSLALTQPQANNGSALAGNYHGSAGPPLFSYSLTPATSLHCNTLPAANGCQQHVQAKRHRPKYQLYVGAYGIPKKCVAPCSSSKKRMIPPRTHIEEDMGLAVQVGEDAYFIRDNAMGVADGVGGWAKVKPRDIPLRPAGATAQPTASALFARRLMHYCSAEADASSRATSAPPLRSQLGHAPPRPRFSFSYPMPRSAPASILMPHASPWQWSDNSSFLSTSFQSSSPPSSSTLPRNSSEPSKDEVSSLQEDLEESLEELSEGIDVLQILERAYDHTLKAHVIPSSESSSSNSTSTPSPCGQNLSNPIDIPNRNPRPSVGITVADPDVRSAKTEMVPLMSGSSTALLAVLDHVPRHELSKLINDSAILPSISTTDLEAEDRHDAVIKIAHVGDCMGMLVRGEEIAWRSQEMWWNFNTPVQLGPSTSATPRTSAHVFTLPVRADDILILATDGLSDNLWDEDVLDEVVRFRRNFLGLSSVSAPGAEKDQGKASPALTAAERVLRRRTLAGMLSEALCSRARRVSERRRSDPSPKPSNNENEKLEWIEDDEVPFARRAREAGKMFRGGKNDDISVIVAVISPAADLVEESSSL